MKKRIFPLLLLAALLLAACGGSTAEGLTGTVNTDGSTSMADVMAVLQETFQEREPGITVNYSGTGSGAGVEAVLTGRADIGLSSRPLKEAELDKGAVAWTVALDGVAVIVHPSNPVSGLTLAQLEQVFTGQVDNWSALGGPDAPVAVYGREAGSGTRGAFEELLGVTDRCDYTNEYGSSGDVVGNVSGNPNAIGYTSLASVGSTVSALAVEGAACTEETVRSGAYPIQRPFLLVTREGEALSPAAQAFLDYACGGEAGPYIARAGAVAP